MGDFRAVLGRRANLLGRGVTSMDPAAHIHFPVGHLHEGRPIQPARFGSNAIAPKVTVDTDELHSLGDFEAWVSGLPVGFTAQLVGDGTVTQNTNATHKTKGTSSVALFTDGDVVDLASVISDPIEVPAGEAYRVRVRLKSDGTRPVHMGVQNPKTGCFVQPNGTWAPGGAPTAVVSHTGSSFSTHAATDFDFVVQGFEECNGPSATLSIWIWTEGVNAVPYTAYADELELIPGSDGIFVFGHNIDSPQSSIVAEGADSTNFVVNHVTLAAAVIPRQPAFYALWNRSFSRYLRAYPVSNNPTRGPVYYGEFYFAQTRAFLKNMNRDGYELRRVPTHDRAEMESGDVSLLARADQQPQALAARFDHYSHAQMEDARDLIWGMSEDGVIPVVIIPDDARPDVIMGILDSPHKYRRVFRERYKETDLVVRGLPFPIFTA